MVFTNPDLEYITDAEISDAESLHLRYITQLVLYQILIFIQFALIVTTMVTFYRQRKTKVSEKNIAIKKNIKRLFIIIMSLGTLVFLLVEWYGIADFLYDYAKYTNYCNVAAKLGNITIMSHYLALYLFYLYRLYATFNGSPFELSNTFIRIALVFTFGIYLVLIISVFVLQNGETIQVWYSWSGDVSDFKWITICAGEFSIGIDPVIRIVLEVIIVAANIFYGWLFYKKLYDLLAFMEAGINPSQKDSTAFSASFLANNETDIESLSRIFQLMNKQTTLVMVSTMSTTLFWSAANIAHYLDSYLQVLIYLDITANVICLWLMFSWNESLYRYWCTPCTLLTDMCCSKCTKSSRILEIGKAIDLQNMHSSYKSSTRSGSKGSKGSKGSNKPHMIGLHIHPDSTPEHSKKSTTRENTINSATDKSHNDIKIKIITKMDDKNILHEDVEDEPIP